MAEVPGRRHSKQNKKKDPHLAKVAA